MLFYAYQRVWRTSARYLSFCAFGCLSFPERGVESGVFGGSPLTAAVLLVFMPAGRERKFVVRVYF